VNLPSKLKFKTSVSRLTFFGAEVADPGGAGPLAGAGVGIIDGGPDEGGAVGINILDISSAMRACGYILF
jgi:hypothetical protein